MAQLDRRTFLKSSGMSVMPAIMPFNTLGATGSEKKTPPENPIVRLTSDGEIFEPAEYLSTLQSVQAKNPIIRDRYGSGGVVESLEKLFSELTGKEKSIYMPTGTMANQFALAALSGDRTKVVVQETSHVYRDEADAAQSVFGKRLIALAREKTFFSAEELKSVHENLPRDEYIPGNIGAVSIENPNRRMNGTVVPLEEIKRISAYCRKHNIGLHLDGARIFMASAWTGVSVKEYSSYFDTVYISLYKYLGASGGAILSGPAAIIDKMPLLIKIHGGNIAGNWLHAAMAMHRFQGFETRLQNAISASSKIFAALNKTTKIKVEPLPDGTNIFSLTLTNDVDGPGFREELSKVYNIRVGGPDGSNRYFIYVNETLLNQSSDFIINAFLKCARV